MLRLYYANDLLGPRREHPKSAIVRNNRSISRPAGRLLEVNGKIIRVPQNCYPTYGRQVRAFEIRTISTAEYEEKGIKESPILKASGSGWDANGMYKIDVQKISENYWIACVDGVRRNKKRLVFTLKK